MTTTYILLEGTTTDRGQLREIRQELDVRAEDVAARSGVGKQQIYRVEQYDVRDFKVSLLARHVAAMGGRLKITVEFDQERPQ